MNMIFNNYNIGLILKTIRKTSKLTQEEFGKKIGKPTDWVTVKEIEKNRITITDFNMILNTFNFELKFISNKTNRVFKLNDFTPGEILKFMRESTEESQTEFAGSIGKTRSWQFQNESGDTNYYANDLLALARKHDFEIELRKK